jgi:prepilin-type N-terminal cleavage/methylation domain-containing protein
MSAVRRSMRMEGGGFAMDGKCFVGDVREGARHAAGFSLLEVMIAMAILAVGMLAVAAAQLNALRIAADSDDRAQAMYLAQDQMDLFMAMPSDDARLDNATGQDGAAHVVGGSGDFTEYWRSWTIDPVSPSSPLRRITVRVRWAAANEDFKMVELVGMKGNQ